MANPKIIIADSDINYISPIQLKFIEEFFDRIHLEIITSEEYFNKYFSDPRSIDILVISEEFYDASIKRHNIGQIFLMTEQQEEEHTADLTINRIYKYTSIKEIFNEISGKSGGILNTHSNKKKEPEIILVYSANGGCGKTTVAMGISACLSKNYKKVLYINASRMHCFQRMLDNPVAISSSEVYSSLIRSDSNIYTDIKHIIRKEKFYYLPPFKTALLSLGVPFSIFNKLAEEAKISNDYDYIVVDTDSTFDEDTAEIFNSASKVIIVTNQSEASVYSTNVLISNLNGVNSDKYIFVCNNFSKDIDNALISPNISPNFSVSEYIEHIDHFDSLRVSDLEQITGIQKTTFLII